jgi:predicted transcriptional regulator
MVAACVNEYFRDQDKGDDVLDKQEEARASIQVGYRAVLDSKSSDETLVSNLATFSLSQDYLFSFCDSLKIINDMYACIMIA